MLRDLNHIISCNDKKSQQIGFLLHIYCQVRILDQMGLDWIIQMYLIKLWSVCLHNGRMAQWSAAQQHSANALKFKSLSMQIILVQIRLDWIIQMY